jgi:hypothetical protein
MEPGRTGTTGSKPADRGLSDRRRSPRIELLGQLHGHEVSLQVDVKVREISLGGMAIETPFGFPLGAVHQFRLTLGDGSVAALRGRVVHCRFEARTGVPGFYVTGFEFIDDAAEREAAVGGLIGKIR